VPNLLGLTYTSRTLTNYKRTGSFLLHSLGISNAEWTRMETADRRAKARGQPVPDTQRAVEAVPDCPWVASARTYGTVTRTTFAPWKSPATALCGYTTTS